MSRVLRMPSTTTRCPTSPVSSLIKKVLSPRRAPWNNKLRMLLSRVRKSLLKSSIKSRVIRIWTIWGASNKDMGWKKRFQFMVTTRLSTITRLTYLIAESEFNTKERDASFRHYHISGLYSNWDRNFLRLLSGTSRPTVKRRRSELNFRIHLRKTILPTRWA